MKNGVGFYISTLLFLGDGRMKRVLIFIFICTFFLSACVNNEKIEISSPSYMYSGTYKIDKKVNVVLRVNYNNKEDNYEGALTINDITFEKILFKHNASLISYKDSERTVLGDIYFDKKENQFAIIVTDPSLFKQLTNEDYKNEGLVISSPASSLEEAIEIEDKLKTLE